MTALAPRLEILTVSVTCLPPATVLRMEALVEKVGQAWAASTLPTVQASNSAALMAAATRRHWRGIVVRRGVRRRSCV